MRSRATGFLLVRLIEGSGNEVHLFDTTSGSPLHVFTNPTQPITDGGFGVSLAIDGDRFLIGASHDPAQGDNVGQAYLFDATSYDLIHSFADPTPTSLDYFGRVVALKDNIVLIGARQDDTSIEDAGQAHVFDAVTGNLLQTLNDPTPAEDERFGTAVAIGGDYLVVGAYRHHTEQRIDAGQVQVFSNDFGARPFFDDQAFGVSEHTIDGTLVGTLAATDADGDALSFAITTNVDPDGDGNDAFRLEGHQVVVNDADDFDYEANAQLVITAVVSDGSLADTAQITVNTNHGERNGYR